MSLKYIARSFDQLTVHELHEILRLRTDIFVVEQNCAYHEVDGRDPACIHVLGKNDGGELIAYARIVPPERLGTGDHNEKFHIPEQQQHPKGLPHIGRVVVRAGQRGKGHARDLMEFTLAELASRNGSRRSALAAQAHLQKFYGSFGFTRIGEEYPWDGIPHVDMKLEPEEGSA